MKITLAFDIFNKRDTIREVVESWLNTLSGQHKIEVIAVFDALRDSSDSVVAEVTANYPLSAYKPLYMDDVFEIKANNNALDSATGDIIVFCQDDTLIYDAGWDDTLATCFDARAPFGSNGFTGAVGLLAGVGMNRDFSYHRIECYRPHKHAGAWVHGITKDAYPLSVYQVDFINRPFAISVPLLRNYGGLDEAYCPMDWDDADLSFKLAADGFVNYYVPFDLVNTSAKQQTLTSAQMSANYQHGEAVAKQRWGQWVAERQTSVKQLWSMAETSEGLLLT